MTPNDWILILCVVIGMLLVACVVLYGTAYAKGLTVGESERDKLEQYKKELSRPVYDGYLSLDQVAAMIALSLRGQGKDIPKSFTYDIRTMHMGEDLKGLRIIFKPIPHPSVDR